jgi:hypothetical protein
MSLHRASQLTIWGFGALYTGLIGGRECSGRFAFLEGHGSGPQRDSISRSSRHVGRQTGHGGRTRPRMRPFVTASFTTRH